MIELKPLSKGQILDQTFRIYKNNFLRFLTIIAIVYVPVSLLQFGLQVLPLQLSPSLETAGDSAMPIFIAITLIGSFIGILLTLIGQNLGNTALVAAIANHYLGKSTTVGEAYQIALPKLLTVILAGVLSGIIVIIGFFLLVVPGVIFSIWFCMIAPAIVVEDKSAVNALGRSKELAGGNLSKIFFILLALFLIGVLAMFGQMMLMELVFGGTTQQGGTFELFINHLGQMIIQILVAPIGAIAINLLYFDLRIRKEGFDLEMMAQSMGSEPSGLAGGIEI